MTRPLHIWSIFALSLVLVLSVMIWLTMKINQSDRLINEDHRLTEIARRETELQELVNSALYRIDARFTPLIAKEAARPYYLYQSFYNPVSAYGQNPLGPIANATKQLPSPLMVGAPKYVQLHFQVLPDGSISSPQRPKGRECELATACSTISASEFESRDEILDKVQEFCSFEVIRDLCPSSRIDNPSVFAGDGQTIYLEPTSIPISPSYGNNLPQQSRGKSTDTSRGEPKDRNKKSFDSLASSDNNRKLEAQRLRNQARGNIAYQQRRDVAQKSAQLEWNNFNALSNVISDPNQSLPSSQPSEILQREIREGIMRPFWVDDNLLLARRVSGPDDELVQCCWLDWEQINQDLRESFKQALLEIDVSDFDDFGFVPVTDEDDLEFDHALATLPVQLVLNSQKLLASFAIEPFASDALPQLSGLRLALIVAWCGLFFAIGATAIMLNGVVRLSERRAAFVSAVTHELRTPLTTFRMYAEMMAEKMVPPEKQQLYAETLTEQADRLSHLVENVLQFAKLEQSPSDGRLSVVSISQLINSFAERLSQRSDQASMTIEFACDECDVMQIKTDTAKIEQIVYNLVDNACKYACESDDKRIIIACEKRNRKIAISISDFGPGVDSKFRSTLFLPFCKSDQDAANSAPGVGLGLALCERMAKSIGAKIYLDKASRNKGARFILELPVL